MGLSQYEIKFVTLRLDIQINTYQDEPINTSFHIDGDMGIFFILGMVLLLILVNTLWFLSILKRMSYETKFNAVKTIFVLTYP